MHILCFIMKQSGVLAIRYRLPCPAKEATSCPFQEKVLLTDGLFNRLRPDMTHIYS